MIDNGVLVSRTNRSTWTVTGTFHRSRSVLDATPRVVEASGTVPIAMNGANGAITPGTTHAGAALLAAG